jgi:hypothetical protein
MERKKHLEKLFLHSMLAGFGGTLAIGAIKAINYVYDLGTYQETFLIFLGYSMLLGLGILFILISAFQIVALSVKRQEAEQTTLA